MFVRFVQFPEHASVRAFNVRCKRVLYVKLVDVVGMGRDRTEIIHEGMRVLPLCREHHTEMHSVGKGEFLSKYHLCDGIPADKTICKLYKLKARRQYAMRARLLPQCARRRLET